MTFSRRPRLPQQNRGRIASGGGSAPPYIVVAYGNSITLGTGASNPATTSYPPLLQALLDDGSIVYREGFGGAQTALLYANFATNVGNDYPSGDNRVMIIWEIRNSLATGVTAANALRDIKRLCGRALAWGFRTVVATALPGGDITAGEEANRVSVNADVLSQYPISGFAGFAHVAVDFGAIPELQDVTSVTYYLEAPVGVHLLDPGYPFVAALAQPAVESALLATLVDYPTVVTGNTDSIAWFDAREEYAVVATGVQDWLDRWGGVTYNQGTGTSQPTYDPVGWNGTSPALSFDGASDFYQLFDTPLATRINGTNRPFTIATTIRNGGVNRIIAGWVGASGARNFLRTEASGFVRLERRDNAANTATHTGAIALGTTASSRYRVVLSFDGSVCRIWVNGVADVVTAAGSAIGAQTFDRTIVGVFSGANWFLGEMADLHYAARAWDADDVARDYAFMQAYRGGLP